MPKVIPEYREEARRKIIVAGLAVMSEKGYHETTMDDIATYVGVSKTTLYLYFRNKDDLAEEIIRDLQRSHQEIAVHLFHTEPPLEAYTHLLDHFLSCDMKRIGFNMEILALATRNERLRKIYEAHMNVVIERAAEGIRSLQKKGKVSRNLDPETVAISMIYLMTGVTNLLLKGMSREEIVSRFTAMGRIILGLDASASSVT